MDRTRVARTNLSFLTALLVVVANDHVFKQLWPGWITGKLSDFAGVLALALFLGSIVPRLAACAITALLFFWWKSPVSQAFIEALPWSASRVVDWTDLFALCMLLPAYRILPPVLGEPRMRVGVAALSVLAFTATSVPHTSVSTEPGHRYATVSSGMTRSSVLNALQRCEIEATDPSKETVQLSMDAEVEGKVRGMFAYVSIGSDGTITVRSMQVFAPEEVDHEAARAAVHAALLKCISEHRR